MRAHFSTHFDSYTGPARLLEVRGATLAEALEDIERQCPGLRFRIIDEQDQVRRHVKLFVNQQTVEDLAARLSPADEIHILGALSGG